MIKPPQEGLDNSHNQGVADKMPGLQYFSKPEEVMTRFHNHEGVDYKLHQRELTNVYPREEDNMYNPQCYTR